MDEIAQLLRRANTGDPDASRELFALLYNDLKRLAHSRLRARDSRSELATTALVHESFLKLAERGAVAPADRAAFFAYIGNVMRNVVVDAVRQRRAGKRGGDASFVTLTTGIAGESIGEAQLLAIDDAMTDLARLAPDLRTLVEMRYFAGMSTDEISEVTGRSVRTIERDWEKARALLRRLMDET